MAFSILLHTAPTFMKELKIAWADHLLEQMMDGGIHRANPADLAVHAGAKKEGKSW